MVGEVSLYGSGGFGNFGDDTISAQNIYINNRITIGAKNLYADLLLPFSIIVFISKILINSGYAVNITILSSKLLKINKIKK